MLDKHSIWKQFFLSCHLIRAVVGLHLNHFTCSTIVVLRNGTHQSLVSPNRQANDLNRIENRYNSFLESITRNAHTLNAVQSFVEKGAVSVEFVELETMCHWHTGEVKHYACSWLYKVNVLSGVIKFVVIQLNLLLHNSPENRPGIGNTMGR